MFGQRVKAGCGGSQRGVFAREWETDLPVVKGQGTTIADPVDLGLRPRS